MSVSTPAVTPPVLGLAAASFAYGEFPVIENVSFSVARGEFLAIVGPSGCGKSTLLSLLSGEISPASGSVERSGATRTVFQSDGLFPWKTVEENIALGLGSASDDAARMQVQEMVTLIGLDNFGDHYPHQLSGGMRQRAELARALIGETTALLLDEPFSALDYLIRLKMRRELSRLIAERPRAVVLVTHDIEEAAQLADRILVLTERPARVRCEIDVRDQGARPRDPTDPLVVATVRRILEELGQSG